MLQEMAEPPVLKGNTKTQRYESLVDALYQDVFRYAYWICKNRPLAEDLVQETFLRAWRSLDSLQNDKAAKAWLFTILRRENARLYERYRPDLVDIEEQSIPDSSFAEPDEAMDQELLHKAINRLESDYRDPLLLQVIGGFSGKEIAEILNLNSNTVMTRLFRARSKLKKEFDTQDKTTDSHLDELTKDG
jgi:RNA polymerase sigma-70 factor (ECF subfamily)